MNGRKLYREFAQSKGKEAKEFDKIERGFFTTSDTLHTKDNNGYPEQTSLDYEDVVNWIIANKKFKDE